MQKSLKNRKDESLSPYKKITFSDEDVKKLIEIIENKEHKKVHCFPEFNGIWIRDKGFETEMRLLILADFRVTVSRVCFSNRRQGLMTDIYCYLKEFCKEHNICQIMIQSVETKEMANWCIKHGFKPNPSSSLKLEEFICGDYVIDV